MKYSVILPTLWKSSRIGHLLQELLNTKYVDDLILISNAPPPLELTFSAGVLHKLNWQSPKENIYVNPAWNLGVELSKNDNFILLSDDINFDPNIYFHCLNQINLKEAFVGIDGSTFNHSEPPSTPPILSPGSAIGYGWGSLIAGNKSNWVPIPNDMKIWCGDNWIKSKTNTPSYSISNIQIKGECEITSGLPIFDEVKSNDVKLWEQYLQD